MERKSVIYPNEYLKSRLDEGVISNIAKRIDDFMKTKFADIAATVAFKGVDPRDLEEEDLETLRDMLKKKRYEKETIDLVINAVRKKAKL